MDLRSQCDDLCAWYKSRLRALNIWQSLLGGVQAPEFRQIVDASSTMFGEV